MTIFVCMASRSISTAAPRPVVSASRRALAWSSCRRLGPSSRAMSPAAARMPAWRMPPPSALRMMTRAIHLFPRADEHRANRRTQSFRQAEHHGGKAAGQFADADAECDRRIEDARAVQMDRHAAPLRSRPDLFHHWSGVTVPPAMLWVFSSAMRPVGARW